MDIRIAVASLALALAGAQPAAPARAEAGDATARPAYRTEFLAAAVALAAGRTEDYERRRRHLQPYVLAPYLDYAGLRRDLRTLEPARARAFLGEQAGTQLGAQFRREWLTELARRQDWPAFIEDDREDAGAAPGLRCLRLRARLEQGDGAGVREELLALWPTGQGLPDACDPAIAHGRAQGWLDASHTWQRLRLAMDAGNAGLASHLAKQLPPDQRADGERLARAHADPAGTLAAAATWGDEAIAREAAAWALRQRARSGIDDAMAQWRVLEPRLTFTADQRAAILRELALYAAVDFRADAEDWFERVPQAARDEQLAQWQLRAALARLDWTAVKAVANGLPAPLSDTPQPRYWRARALAELGQDQAASDAFAALASESNFHGFLAADRAGLPYSICPDEVAPDPDRAAALRELADLARALELHAVGWRAEAARAWDHQMASLSPEDRDQALLLAAGQGWHDRAVFALNSGDNLRKYALRFPVAQRATVERETAANGIDPAWVYALIRAESAWQPDARSHADAWGLMQLIPATGRQMARELSVPWNGTSTLLDAATNIRLGTRYLAQQAERFAGSPWLASAAYNAGPAPVQRWLGQRDALPADVFIETIPYKETREYVARVLAFSVIYDWRLYGKARPMSSRLPDPGERYGGVPAPEQARPVQCARPPIAANATGADRSRSAGAP
jgi:soluble lytic murein transglycosylase